MPEGSVVFDTTCLLYFTVTGHEDLLAERYGGRCYLPDEVRVEIERGEAEHGYNCARLLGATWWQPLGIVEPEDQALFFSLLQRWGRLERNRGEAAAIVLARRYGYVAVVDDLQGRRAAERLGVRRIGTVGILAKLASEGRLDEGSAWRVHEEMVGAGFRSPLRAREDFHALLERLIEPS